MRSAAKKLARTFWNALVEVQLRRELALTPGEPRLLYASAIPPAGKVAAGGAVKLLDLSKKYPDGLRSGNILYLVTSALPRSAEAWVRAAKEKRIRVIINQNGVAYPAWASPADQRRINERNARLLRLADGVIFQSEFCLNAVDRWVIPVRDLRGRHWVLHNPVDSEQIQLGAGISKRVLILGSHHHADRVRVAIEAIAILARQDPEWSLQVAGPFRWSAADQDFARWSEESGLGDRLIRTGPYSREELPVLVGSASVVLHLQDKDASPTVPLEAQAAGAAVVGIRSGGMPELVNQDAGILIPVEETWMEYRYPSAEQVSDALKQAASEAYDQRETRRKNVIQKFGLSRWLGEQDRIFRELLDRGPH